ncbi:MAG: cell division protein ZapA [Alphaproteobacteria bacterium]
MAQIDVTINDRSYKLACEEGEEEHLRELSRFVDRQVSDIKREFGQIGDARLLVMASLTIADKLSEAYTKLEKLDRDVTQIRVQSEQIQAETKRLEEKAAEDLDTLSGRIETLTGQFKDA